jgi:HK97 family phage prohead protease
MSHPERRISPDAVKVETRTLDGTSAAYLVGYASVNNEWTTLMEFPGYRMREIVRPGAFTAALAERQDVRSLFNHDPNFVLGRTASGTLSLRELDRGLYQETRLSGSQMVQDLVVTPVSRGDITGQSFAFLPRNEGGGQTIVEKGDGTTIIKRAGERITLYEAGDVFCADRELLSADLFDVTIATYPAYQGTSAGLRTSDAKRLEEEVREVWSKRGRLPRPSAWLCQAEGILRLAECDG